MGETMTFTERIEAIAEAGRRQLREANRLIEQAKIVEAVRARGFMAPAAESIEIPLDLE